MYALVVDLYGATFKTASKHKPFKDILENIEKRIYTAVYIYVSS